MKQSVLLSIVLVGIGLYITGCYHGYVTPSAGTNKNYVKGSPLDFVSSGVGDDFKPTVTFPATLAVARIQTAGNYGTGAPSYRIIDVRGYETELADKMERLPGLHRMVPISNILLSGNPSQPDALRQAASTLKADLLFVYSVNTELREQDWSSPLSVVTFGMAPTVTVKVITTVSGALIDPDTGYLYGVVESTEKKEQKAAYMTVCNAWDQCREVTEQKAMEKMTDQLRDLWQGVQKEYPAGS